MLTTNHGSKVADTRVAMLNKQSTEAMQSSQLFDAEVRPSLYETRIQLKLSWQ